jgi:HAMP domain-containing protein
MKTFAFIPKNLDLGKKLTILMVTIFLIGILAVGIISYKIFVSYAEQHLNARADILISTLDSVRKYNSDRITPLLETQSNQVFLQESVPTFATNKVFQIFVNAYKNDYGDYLYKNAMLNPTNAKDDMASSEETKIIETLKQQDEELAIDQQSHNIDQGYSTIHGKKYFYIARPIKITNANCLSCHSTLAKAPQSLQSLYQQGIYYPNNGLGWPLNTVIGAKVIYVPATEVYKVANKNFAIMLSLFIGIFVAFLLLTNLWLNKYVVLPINRMTKVAEAVSLGDLEANFEKRADDEIGRLAESFTRLKNSFTIAMKRLTKKNSNPKDN